MIYLYDSDISPEVNFSTYRKISFVVKKRFGISLKLISNPTIM